MCDRKAMVGLFVLAAMVFATVWVTPQTRALVITHVNVIDVVDGRILPNRTVTISGPTIASVTPDGAPPADARVVDGTGKFLIPGLWDMHSHQQMTGAESLDLFVANGVTGSRDMGSDADFILPLRDRINRGEVLGPEIIAAGPILDTLRPEGTVPAPTQFFALMRRRVTNAEEAREAVRDLKKRGVDFIKVHDSTPREAYFAIADETRKLGLPFAGHVPVTVSIEEAVESGIKSIEHLANFRVFNDCSVNPPHQAVACQVRFDRLAAKGVWQTPTLAFMQAIPDLFSGKPLPHAEYATDGLLESTRANAEFSKLDERALSWFRANNKDSLAAVHDLAVRGNGVLAACDGLVPGFCVHDELEWMTKAGLSALQAIQTATINPAKYLGRDGIQGSVDAGKRADLVLLDADPLADIRNTRRIAAVVVRGRLLSRPNIVEMVAARRRSVPRQ